MLSIKLLIDDNYALLILTKLEYQSGFIKEESTSELLRFTIKHILNQVHNQPEYLVLKQEQQEQEQVENNQQQGFHNQVILLSITINDTE